MNQRIVTGIVAVVALIAGIWGAVNLAPPSASESVEVKYFTFYPASRPIKPFDLTQANGHPFTKKNLQNAWTLVFVGYTYCPDICPTTMASLNKIWPELSSIKSEYPTQVLFLSVDPKRDTIQRLESYIGYFNEEFIAATGPHKDLFPLVRNLGLMYAIAGDTENPDYLVDHSASVVLINPNAEVIGRFKPIMEPGKLAISDVEQILVDMPEIVKLQ
ncbi:SCO family protein [Aestuariibacter sp. A3R04]|uniref:SCO family protein n=1 Tax=Aestuariibacter sp. A3R04 TaxID=2841571 RepID=UPI001C0856AF|nr:SCO family protein [Aestuariibacter sp. A3R04]MBU3020314.1 SCO family protein [Aestuariibacter sp. A3R04]